MRWKPILFGALVFVLGLGIAFIIPGAWVFRDDAVSHDHADEGAGWACPMFCVVMDRKPADENCPVCGMELGLVERVKDVKNLFLGSSKVMPRQSSPGNAGELE